MTIIQYIRKQYRNGEKLDSIENDLIRQGYDIDIIGGEIDNFKRNKLILNFVSIAFLFILISLPFLIEPSFTGQVVRVRVGKAYYNMADANSVNIIYLIASFMVSLILYWIYIILKKYTAKESFEAVVNERRQKDLMQTKPESEQNQHVHTDLQRINSISYIPDNEKQEKSSAFSRLIQLLQKNYDAGCSLEILYKQAKNKGWEERYLNKAIGYLKVKSSDEFVRNKIINSNI